MSCEQYHDALTDVAAGGSAAAGLEAHLATCEACREELGGIRRVLALAEAEMARVARAEPSPGLAVGIREAVAEQHAARAWPLGWMWPAMAASVVLLVALAAWMVRAPSPARVTVDSRPAVAPGESRPAAERSRTGETPEPTAPSPEAPAFVPAGEGSATTAARHRRRAAPAVVAAPEVLVPRGEAEALVRFAAIVHRDRHTPGAFVTVGRPSVDLPEPAELAIEPLEIVPLDPAETPGT